MKDIGVYYKIMSTFLYVEFYMIKFWEEKELRI